MISDVLKKCLLDRHFVWDGDRCFSRVQTVNVGGNQIVIINGQPIHQQPQQAQLTLTIEDYGQSCVSNLDGSDSQPFNFISFKQELIVGDTNEQECHEDVISFRDFEEDILFQTVQNFLGKA